MKKLKISLPPTVLASAIILVALAVTPTAHAYGSADQWQAGFSGTCLAPSCPGGGFGFWGWCAFGGSSGSSAVGTTGTTADCSFSDYFTSGASSQLNPFHFSFDLSGWTILTGSMFLPAGVPSFFFTSGTLEVTGPGPAAVGIPTNVVFPLSVVCPAGPTSGSLCDSGIPAVPGHSSFHPFPGFAIEVTVTKIPS